MKGRQFVSASALTAAASRLDACCLSLRASISSAIVATQAEEAVTEEEAQAAAENLTDAMVIAADEEAV
jgi:hypothetical protein